MKILADQYLYRLSEFIPEGVPVEYYKPEEGFPAHAADFDALLIRTVTRVNPDTLPVAGHLKFIGTATAGFDHVDTAHLEKLGIWFARSAGCNANAVAEYVLTALYHWADMSGSRLSDKKVGIVGMGHTGGRVAGYLGKLGIAYAGFDPPKEEREPDFTSCSEEELLGCDILTFHVPLTSFGLDDYPTRHMCNTEWLERGFDLIINAARGGVVDEIALLRARGKGLITDYILDVWENEPLFSDEIAEGAFIATPHIAGYSRQAKWLASKIVADQMCDFFSLEKSEHSFRWSPPKNTLSNVRGDFARFLWENQSIAHYDREFRKTIGTDPVTKKEKFARLRSETDTRFEFASIIRALGISESLDPADPLQVFL